MSKRPVASPQDRSAFVIAPEPPYPVAGGGAIRTASILEYLRPRYRVDVLTFRQRGAPTPVFPPDIRVHEVELPFHSRSAGARVFRNLRRAIRGTPPLVDRFSGFEAQVDAALAGRTFHLGLIEHFWCASYGSVLRPACRRMILDLHNVESVLLSRQAAANSGPVRHVAARFARSCRELERRLTAGFDEVLVTSETDRQFAGRGVVYPNALALAPRPCVAKQNVIAFSGNLEYEPNQTGVRWFVRSVWPLIRERQPDVVLRLIGRNHAQLQAALPRDERIQLTGPVQDALVELARAQVAVIPLLSGSGTRIKIIEAWAAELPVVSTSIGAEGLPGIRNEHLLIADSPEEFAAAVHRVLASPDLQARLGTAGRRLYETRLSWPVAWKILEQIGI